MSSTFKKIIMMANQAPSVDTSKYLTMVALEDGFTAQLSVNACQYSFDCVDWVDLPAATATPAINAGDKVYFKATGLTPTSSDGIGTFSTNKTFNLEGNCNSMLFGDEADTNLSLVGYDNAYRNLFRNCTTLQSVSRTFLPATTLATYCYYYMFCNCTSLTTTPELPATTLANSCYGNMFRVCKSLTVAPELPATTLVNSCYYTMFYDCIKLNYIKMLATDISASNCLYYWVYRVSSTGTFVKNVDATWDVTGASGIPTGWTVEDYTP